MAESLTTSAGSKEEKYAELLPQIGALLEGEPDMIACMANVSAALRFAMGFYWVGFYLVRNEALVLGPFQGPIACTRIAKGRGVCGAAWERNETVLVPDVDQFPGHIACNTASKSEIVVPVRDAESKVIAVLDADSDRLNDFDEKDRQNLEAICRLLMNKKIF